jgi:tyrosinase
LASVDPRFTRRRLIGLAAGAGLGGLVVATAGADSVAAPVPVRREITTAPADLAAYAQAVAALRRLPDSDPRSWTGQARIHLEHGRHASWLFFPWHRAYLYCFEQICRAVTGQPGFAVPYWDWSAHPQLPAELFDPTSPLYYPQREMVPGSAADPDFVGPAVVESMLAEPNFLVFGGLSAPRTDAVYGPGYGLVEQGPHNYVHGFVGGAMSGLTSPLDPVFWLHHSRVDQLWSRWSARHRDLDAAAWLSTRFAEFVDAGGRPLTLSVDDVAKLPGVAYRFDTAS